jgi:hypothetical protein
MKWFWILWVFNAIMALIPVAFFFIGLGDGTVSGDNIGLWMIILLVVGLVIGGTYWLKTKNQLQAAKIILGIAAIPSLLFMFFILVLLLTDTRWN